MPRRILLIRLSAIGDVINTLPTVSLLRRNRPDAHIAFLVEDKARDLVVGHPHLDQVFVFPRRHWRSLLGRPRPAGWWQLLRESRSYLRALRDARFDAVLDLQGNLKGGLHAALCGAPRRIGFARGFEKELNHWFSNEQVRPPTERIHRVEKFASLLGPLGIGFQDCGSGDRGDARAAGYLDYVLPDSSAFRPRIESFLRAEQLVPRRFAILHPGTSDRGAGKRWALERYAELARLSRRELDLPAVVTWGPGERELAESVQRLGGDAVKISLATDSLLELAELIRNAAVFISADTGPMHLAAAVGTPCVALFGPKDPAIYRPYGANHLVIHHPDSDGVPGMERISVDEVLQALAQLVAAIAA